MSEESSSVASSNEEKILKIENKITYQFSSIIERVLDRDSEKMRVTNDIEQAKHSEEFLSAGPVHSKPELVPERPQSNENAESDVQLALESPENSLATTDESRTAERWPTAEENRSDHKSDTSDISAETESSENTSDLKESAKTSASSEIPSSLKLDALDAVLEKATPNVELINKGVESLKLNAEEPSGSSPGKKGRKTALTPGARSTPMKMLTSPPLTRSRSRDLMKVQSTPSPGRLVERKNSKSGAEKEIKGARGRQRDKN